MATQKDSKAADSRETLDPAPVTSPPKQQREVSPATLRRNSSNSTIPSLRNQPALVATSTTSTEVSPHASRNTSPVRPGQRSETPQTITRAGTQKSKDNSHDTSPTRSSNVNSHVTVPSAAAIQRALSATSIPQVQPTGPVSEAVSRLPRSTARAVASSDNVPSSASTLSPRLKSPEPSTPVSRRNSLQTRSNHNAPTAAPPPPITVLSSTPTTTNLPDPPKVSSPNPDLDQLRISVKPPSRGVSGPKSNLETVQENTPPLGNALDQSSSLSSVTTNNKSSDEDRSRAVGALKSEESTEKQARTVESESDGNKSDRRGRRQDPPSMSQLVPRAAPSKAAAPLSARARASEGSRNMTVETETVASIPQSQLTADRSGARGEGGGSVRLKPSTETIRPRKERKRPPRKAPSIQNGTASSKADIFEARVASAVDQANSSDSDETFVYESNPPELQHRSHRNHSRTPSNTSMHSQADRRGLRGYLDTHRVAGKRSMKFSNNPYNVLNSPPDGEVGTLRANARHINRIGRTMGSNGSMYDHQDSPFTQASKLRSNTSRQNSRPGTPQSQKRPPSISEGRGIRPWNKKDDLSQYDFEGEGAADDERTPLVGTVRTPRHRLPRRIGSEADYEHIYNIRQSSWLTRFGGCLFGFIVVCLVIIGAAGFLILSNKTLYNVEVRKIQNVLASEQEMVLDLLVGAVNPNVLGITITEMDVIVFAKSKHVNDPTTTTTAVPNATSKAGLRFSKRKRTALNPTVAVVGTPWQDPDGHWHDGDDEGLDGDSQTMLLGHISHFDQPLYFEGSPIKRHAHYSVGEMRLSKPGNKTEAGGSARWEKVLQFPFELILRGIFKYTMPFSNKQQTAAMFGSVIVHPESGIDSQGRMRLADVKTDEKPARLEPAHVGSRG